MWPLLHVRLKDCRLFSPGKFIRLYLGQIKLQSKGQDGSMLQMLTETRGDHKLRLQLHDPVLAS